MDGTGNVTCTVETFGTVVVNDDQADYPQLLDKRLSQPELQQSRSSIDAAMPWIVWPVFVVSITVGGSSAPVILAMKRAAPISLASWRHQVSALTMLPFFIFEWRKLQKFDRSKALNTRSIGLGVLSSLCLATHSACFVWSMDHTSLIHSLFLCYMCPIFVAIYTKLSGGVLMTGEMTGVSLGLIGVAVLAAGTKVENDTQSTYLGDSVAVLAAVSMAGYLVVGRKLRSWMPLFVYQFPVAVLVASMIGTMGLLLEGWNDSAVGDVSGPFGWVRKEYILGTLFLGIGPGVIGHAGYSFVLRYASALVLPTGLSLQPLIGSSLCWAVGESPVPGVMTIFGGAMTLAGTLCCATAKTTEHVQNKGEEYKQPATDDEEGQLGTKPLLQPSDHP